MRRLLVAAMAAVVLAVPATASATAPAEAAGTFTVESMVVTGVRPAGSSCHVKLTATFAFAGTLRGSFTAPFAIAHHGSCTEPARENFHARGVFDGAVVSGGTERAGSFRFSFTGRIDAAGNAQGRLVVRRGRGGLEGLHGLIDLTGVTGVGGTYRGRIHLDPAP